MNNLKKVLALVLVVATLCGFMTVAGAKDFTDAASVQNTEAVEVMSALGVINGYTDGSFKPQGEVTRAEMAKMVTMILNGGEDVGPLYSAGNVFIDCGYHWARGYIAYASNVKLVAGVGDGKFNPDGKVTGTEAAKMLLCALGYDADNEKLVGPTWASNTLALADEAGLLDGFARTFDFSKPLSRDNTAKMMLNALKCDMVKYDSKGNTVTINGAEIGLGGSDAKVVTATGTDSNFWAKKIDATAVGTNEYTVQLGEKCFGETGLSKGLAFINASTTADAFGRPAHKWTKGGDTINTYPNTPDVTYTEAVKAGTIYTDIGKVKVEVANIKLMEDGADVTSTVINGSATFEIASGKTGSYGGQGALTEVYINDDAATVVVIHTYVAEILKFNKAQLDKDGDVKDGGEANITLKASSTPYTKPASASTLSAYKTDAFTKDDEGTVIVYTAAQNSTTATTYDVQSVAVAESVEGVMTRYSDSSSVTVDGTKYSVAVKHGDVKSVDDTDFDGTYTFYLDTYGNVILATLKEAAASGNYVYVEKIKESTDGFEDTTGVQAYVVATDGTRSRVDVATRKATAQDVTGGYTGTAGDVVYARPASGGVTALNEVDGSPASDTMINTWVGYSVNSKGEYTFKAIDGVRATILTVGSGAAGDKKVVLQKDKNTISNLTASTEFYLDKETVVTNIDSDYKVTSFTGLPKQNAQFGVGSEILVTHAKGSKAATAIYVAAQASGLTNEGVTYAYAVKAGESVSSSKGEYIFVVDGVKKTYVKANTLDIDAGSVYKLVLSDDEIDSATKVVSSSEILTNVLVVEDARGTLRINKNTVQDPTYDNIIESSGYAIYDVTDPDAEDIGAITDVDANDTVIVVLENDEAVVVFVTARAE